MMITYYMIQANTESVRIEEKLYWDGETWTPTFVTANLYPCGASRTPKTLLSPVSAGVMTRDGNVYFDDESTLTARIMQVTFNTGVKGENVAITPLP